MTFPFVEELVARGELHIHGAWFDIGSGTLRVMNSETKIFEDAQDLLPRLKDQSAGKQASKEAVESK